jgi:hypothetical protein
MRHVSEKNEIDNIYNNAKGLEIFTEAHVTFFFFVFFQKFFDKLIKIVQIW